MNSEELKQKLQKKFDQIIKSYETGMFKGLSVFYGKIVKEQMSSKPGLNRRSGNLAKGWYIEKKGTKLESEFKLRNREWYGLIHEHDKGFTGIIKPKNKKFLHFFIGPREFFLKQVYIPKRLSVYETFKKIGGDLILKAIKKEIDKEKK